VAPDTVEAYKFNVPPTQIGPLLEAVTDSPVQTVRPTLRDVMDGTDSLAATASDFAGEPHVLATTQSKPKEATTASPGDKVLICNAAVCVLL